MIASDPVAPSHFSPVFSRSAASAMPVHDGLIFLNGVSRCAPQRIGAAGPFHSAPTIKPFDAPLAGSFASFKELGRVRQW
jgi:hypothetical protein